MTKRYVIQMFDEFWLRDGEDSVDEIHDFEQASVFSNKKDARKILSSLNIGEYCKILDYDEELEKFLEYKESGMIRRTLPKLLKERKIYDSNVHDIHDVIEFFIFHSENEARVSYKDYTSWPKPYLMPGIVHEVISYRNDSAENLDHTLSISVDKKISFEEFKTQLLEFKKYSNYKDEENRLVFPIFDHELSQYDSRSLYYNESKDVHEIKGRYRYSYFKGTLLECFNKIQECYWYDSEYEDSHGDEEY